MKSVKTEIKKDTDAELNYFIKSLIQDVRNYLPEDIAKVIEIREATVVKMNDQKFHGITFKMPEREAAPTLYINVLYEAYKEGADISYLAREMADMYIKSKEAPEPPKVDLSFDSVKDKLGVRLLEMKRNREFLSSMPYENVGNGLALTADINFGETSDGDWRIAVNKDLLESMGIDRESLFNEAIKNSQIMDPPMLIDMNNVLFSQKRVNLLDRDTPVAPEDVEGMYVLTTESGMLGAAALFYQGVMQRAGDLLGDYYILPSSIHETILVPEAAGFKADELSELVAEANRTVVEDMDILSDDVFHYSRDNRRFAAC